MRQILKHALLLLSVMALPFLVMAQTKVSGTVKDPNGNPIPGASVRLKNTNTGTSTDSEGNFSLTVPGNSGTIEISSVGFATVTFKVSEVPAVITLTEDVGRLEEVVVTGLASGIKRANSANAVQRIGAKDLAGVTRPPTLDGAMSGKVVGAQITANTGAPGGGLSMRLRGVSTVLGSSEPLYVIDGVIVNNDQFPTGSGTRAFNGATGANAGTQDQAPNRIADINPADIESIDILKGPSAAAIYGSRANAGVVIITTKRGKAGKTRISIGQDVGMARALSLLGSSDWSEEKIALYGGAYKMTEAEALAAFRAANGQTWDHEKQIWGNTGFISNTNLSVSGGNDRTRFYVGASLQDEKGIQKRTGFTRKSIRLNIDHRFNNWIDFKVSSSYLNTKTSRSFTGNDNNGVSLSYTLGYLPNFLNLDRREDGSYPIPPTGQNPFEIVDRAENIERTNRFLNSGELNFQLLKKEKMGLKASFRGGVDYLLSEPRVYMPEDLQYQSIRPNPGASRYTFNKAFYTYVQSALTFNATVGQDIDLTTGAVVLRDDQLSETEWIQGEGLLPGQRRPSTAQVQLSEALVNNKSTVVAYDLSQEVNWGDKIIARVGVRADKSTLSGLNYDKLYYYPRGNVAVNLTNFGFWKSNIISQLKPRAAYGETSGFPTFTGVYSPLASTNYGGQLGAVAPTILGVSALDPERASELEFGLDLGLFNNRVTFEGTYYIKKIKDFLFNFALAPSSGVTSYAVFPVGDMENKGLELGLNAGVIRQKNFQWNTGLSWWKNESEITRLDVPPAFVPNSGFGAYGRKRLQQGFSPTAWWGFNEDGQLIAYKDFQPDFQMSWSNNLRFLNGFEFNMLWHTAQGGHNSSLTRLIKDEGGTTTDWSNPGKSGDPIGVERQETIITNFIFDASYIRLRETSLYYTLPKSLVSSAFKNAIEGIRVGVSGQNLITITDYYGYDPEVSNFNTSNAGGALTGGVDLTPFPAVRRFFFHINIDL